MGNPTNTTGLHVASVEVGGTANQTSDAFIKLASLSSAPSSTTSKLYNLNGVLYFESTSLEATGSGGAGSLDDAYSNGRAITLDEGAITLTDATAGTAQMLTIVKSGAGSGNMIDVAVSAALTGNVLDVDMDAGLGAKAIYIDAGAGTRTADLIDVKHDGAGNTDVFNVTATNTGTGSIFDINMDGAGSTDGVFNIDMNAAVGAECFYIDVGGGVRTANLLEVKYDGSGAVDMFAIVATDTSSGHIFDIDMGGVHTGNVFDVDMNAAVGAKFLYLDAGAGTRTADLIDVKHDGDGNVDVMNITATNTGTGAIFDINMDGNGSNAGVFNVDMNAAVGAEFVYLDAGGGTRTANLFEVVHDGDGNVDVFSITDSNTGTGSVFDIAMSGATASGAVMKVDMNAAVARPFLFLDYGAGVRTEDMCQVTYDGSGTAPFWDINITNTGAGGTSDYWDIDVDAVFTGSILDVTYGTAAATGDTISINMGTAVGASALVLAAAGARTDDLIKIDDASTGNSHIFDINLSAAYTGNVFDVALSSTATGKVIAMDMDAGVGATAIFLDAGNATRTVDLIDITFDGNGNVGILDATVTNTGSGNLIELDIDAVHTGSAFLVSYGTGAATGDAVTLTMGTNVAGRGIAMTSSATGVSGEGAAIDITHDGNLVAGADVMNITSTGSISSTSNLLALEQSTGASTAGANCLYISATGANVEAIKVDDGNVTFDENLSVGGTTTLTGAVTATAGVQSAAVARTVTAAPGGTTGVIADGTSVVVVTSDDANKVLTLPTPTPGNIVWILPNSTGYELRSSDPATIAINGGTGSNAESAVGANYLVRCVCCSATTWVCSTFSTDGTEAKLEAAAA